MPAASALLLPLLGPMTDGTPVGVLLLAPATRIRIGALLRSLGDGVPVPLAADDAATPVRVDLVAPPAYDPWAPDPVDAALATVVEGRAPALLVHHQDGRHLRERIDAWGGAAESGAAPTAALHRSGDTVAWTLVEETGARWRCAPLPIAWLRSVLALADAYAADHGGE